MVFYINPKVFYCIGFVLFFLFGFFLSGFLWEKKYNSLVDSIPEGKTLYLGELTDEQCDDVLELIQKYTTEHNLVVTFTKLTKEDDK